MGVWFGGRARRRRNSLIGGVFSLVPPTVKSFILIGITSRQLKERERERKSHQWRVHTKCRITKTYNGNTLEDFFCGAQLVHALQISWRQNPVRSGLVALPHAFHRGESNWWTYKRSNLLHVEQTAEWAGCWNIHNVQTSPIDFKIEWQNIPESEREKERERVVSSQEWKLFQ